jgi:hypothetical protein
MCPAVAISPLADEQLDQQDRRTTQQTTRSPAAAADRGSSPGAIPRSSAPATIRRRDSGFLR